TKVNINPKPDGSVDVTWTKPVAVEPAPILYEKKDMLESLWAIFEEHPRVLWKDLAKHAEGKEEIATASEIIAYFESKGKEVLGKPKAKVVKEKRPFKYKDELLQDINELVGKIKPNPDYSRSELQKILPLSMIGAKADPDAKEMDIAANLSASGVSGAKMVPLSVAILVGGAINLGATLGVISEGLIAVSGAATTSLIPLIKGDLIVLVLFI
ncbi:unnamed protein product, partial [marine sediment metagenome]